MHNLCSVNQAIEKPSEDRPTYKIVLGKILIYERNLHRKSHYSILIRGEESYVSNIFTFLPFVA